MKITKAQEKWLEEHLNDDPKQLAKDTGLSLSLVKKTLKTLQPKVEPTEKPVEKPVEKTTEELDIDTKTKKSRLAGFIVDDGSVIMTPGRSQKDDEVFQDNLSKNKEFWEAHKDHIILMKKNPKRIPIEDEE